MCDFLFSAEVQRCNTDILMRLLWSRLTVYTGNVSWLCPESSFSFTFIIPSSICQHPFEHLCGILWLKQIKREQIKLHMSYCSQCLTSQPPKGFPHFCLEGNLAWHTEKKIYNRQNWVRILT